MCKKSFKNHSHLFRMTLTWMSISEPSQPLWTHRCATTETNQLPLDTGRYRQLVQWCCSRQALSITRVASPSRITTSTTGRHIGRQERVPAWPSKVDYASEAFYWLGESIVSSSINREELFRLRSREAASRIHARTRHHQHAIHHAIVGGLYSFLCYSILQLSVCRILQLSVCFVLYALSVMLCPLCSPPSRRKATYSHTVRFCWRLILFCDLQTSVILKLGLHTLMDLRNCAIYNGIFFVSLRERCTCILNWIWHQQRTLAYIGKHVGTDKIPLNIY